MNIVPRLGERGILVGRTKSGKTTTAVRLLRPLGSKHQLYLIDTKGDDKLETVTTNIIEDPKRALRESDHVLYRPDGELNFPPALDGFLEALYRSRRSMVVYIDELYQVSPGPNPRVGLANLLMRGRYRKTRKDSAPVQVTTLMATQRPSRIPRSCFSESERFYVHYLSREADRETVAEEVGDDGLLIPARGHEFWYYDLDMYPRPPIRLKVPPL